jgi:hypothetical protein
MQYVEELAQKHGLDCYHEGVLPVRICGVYTDEILCAYKFYYRGSGQQAMRDMMASLQLSLDSMIAAGVD